MTLAEIKELRDDAENSPRVTERERDFLDSLIEQYGRWGNRFEPSEKQLDWFSRIQAKVYA